jgi:hypothetical protein
MVANRFGVSSEEALDVISRKIMRDYVYAKKNGYDQFMKRFNKDSKLDSLRDDQIDDFIKNEYEQDYIGKVGSDSLPKAKAKEAASIQKAR